MKERTRMIIYVILVLIASITLSFLFTLETIEQENIEKKCLSEFGGKMRLGYCTYLENGTSRSVLIKEGDGK